MFSKTLSSRKWLVAVVAFATAFPVVASAGGEGAIPVTEEPILPHIVLLLLDDGRADTLKYMPNVRRLLVRPGLRFTNGYVVNPVCCPSRASILTGAYSHTTGVYTNKANSPFGGFAAFDDDSTIATWLQAAGYRTGLFGKYMNGYRRTTYVPPGWDRWFATYGAGGNSAYYNYTAVSDGIERHYGSKPSDYGQTVLQREAASFIRSTDPSQPVFVYWATPAPHAPATPSLRDRKSFTSLAPWRPAGYDETDVSDKPIHVQVHPRIDRALAREIDGFRLAQIRSLQATDRAIERIVEALRETDRLSNTMIVFTSDNGYLWGEHRLHSKSEIYEEAVSVPFVVRYDPMIDRARAEDSVALNIDLAPTFAELAGIEAPDAEGRSLLPILRSSAAPRHRAFLIEHLGNGHGQFAPTFCAIHTEGYVLVRYASGEEELYDLARDPHQLENRDGWSQYRDRRRTLRAQLRTLCDPLPPGFSF